MSKKFLERVVKGLIFATFFVPLVVVPSSFIFPFIVPKILLFRSITTLILALYAVLVYINPREYRPKATFLSWAVLAFLVSFALSTFFGTDPYHSFWDNHERMLGLFTILHYVAYFYVCSQVFKTWTEWRIALQVFLIAGSLVMFVAFRQVIDPNYLLNGGSARVIGTLGNAIYVGGYGLFLFSIAVLLILKEKNIWWRLGNAALAMLAVAGIFFSGTRGTMLGLLFGMGLAVPSYIYAMRGNVKVRNSLIGLVVFGLVVSGALLLNRDSKFVRDVPALDRILHTSVTELTGGARIVAWGAGIDGWKERPLLGWGPNNFFYAFNDHYNPRSLEFGYGETWFDNAHNIIVNTLAVQGIVGLVTYLAIFVAALFMLIKGYFGKRVDPHVAIIVSAYLLAHLVENVTVFENPTSYLYFVFILAFANSIAKSEFVGVPAPQQKVVINRNAGFGVVAVSLALASLFIFILNIQPARANMKTLEALQYISNDPAEAAPVVEEALHFSSPHIDDIRSDISRSIAGVLTNQNLDATKKAQLFTIAEDALLSNVDLHPLDIRNQLSLSQLYQTEAIQKNNVEDMVKAEFYLKQSLELSPRRQQIIYNLAIVEMQLGKNAEAEQMFKGAIKDDPKIAESYIRLGYMYLALQQPQKIKDVIELANQNRVAYSDSEQNSVNQLVASFLVPTSSVKKK
jgi:O-antigen ligase